MRAKGQLRLVELGKGPAYWWPGWGNGGCGKKTVGLRVIVAGDKKYIAHEHEHKTKWKKIGDSHVVRDKKKNYFFF